MASYYTVLSNDLNKGTTRTPRLSRAQVALERDCVPLSETSLKAVVSCQAPAEAEQGRRAPLRLVAVLDKSGSMAGEKIRLVKQTMVFMRLGGSMPLWASEEGLGARFQGRGSRLLVGF